MFESRGAASDAIVPGLEQSGLAQRQTLKKMHIPGSLGPTRIALKAEILVCFGIHVEIPRGPSIYQPNMVLSM